MTDLYSFKGSFPYALLKDMTGYDMADFILAGQKPDLQSGEVLEWANGAWSVRAPNDSEQEFQVQAARQARNALLTGSDWTQVVDAPVDAAAWAVYRQALRAVPSQAGFPWTIDWPVAP